MTDLPGLLERVKKAIDDTEPLAAQIQRRMMNTDLNETSVIYAHDFESLSITASVLHEVRDALIANPDLARVKV